MKLKKFFAGVVAAAMMLTVGATAVLATNTTDSMIVADNNGVANFTLTKKLMVVEGTAPQKMTFNFTVSAHDADAAKGAKAGTLGKDFTTQPSVTLEKTGDDQFTASTTAYSQNFSIDLVKLLGDNYNKVGKYTYTISEDETKIPGITKDAHEYEMIVSVVNKQKENLDGNTGYGYYVAMYNSEGTKVPAEFSNTYNSYSLKVEKTVKGDFGDLNQEFTFVITLDKANGMNNNYANATVTSTNTDNNDGAWTWTADGQAQKTVTLKHGQAAIISNLPVGVTYTVTEKDADAEGWVYTTTGEVETATAINAEKNEVTIINDHKGVPDMGVILDNAPYIALLAIVAIGGVALMLNKRRRDEE